MSYLRYFTRAYSTAVNPSVPKMRQFLVVGLGNHTHLRTRHSVGQLIVEALAKRFDVTLTEDRLCHGWVASKTIDIPIPKKTGKGKGKGKQKEKATEPAEEEPASEAVEFVFLKPKLLMNLSGKAVQDTLRNRIRRPPSARNVIVIHDSLDRKPLEASIKQSGSANGHNGVKDVIRALSSYDFPRVRIGIGAADGDVSDYVLGQLPNPELRHWVEPEGKGLDDVWRTIESIVLQSRESTRTA